MFMSYFLTDYLSKPTNGTNIVVFNVVYSLLSIDKIVTNYV